MLNYYTKMCIHLTGFNFKRPLFKISVDNAYQTQTTDEVRVTPQISPYYFMIDDLILIKSYEYETSFARGPPLYEKEA